MDHRKIQRKEELRQALASSRELIGSRTDDLLEELDLKAKLQRSIQNNPILWGTGVFFGAIMLFRLFAPAKQQPVIIESSYPRSSAPSRSRLKSALSVGAGFAAPYAKKWAAHFLRKHFSSFTDRFLPPSDTHH